MTLALLPTAVGAQTFDAVQNRRPMPVRATPKQSRGARAFATFDVNMLAATETFRAITGTSTFTAIGAGGRGTRRSSTNCTSAPSRRKARSPRRSASSTTWRAWA